ncbi:hypothetical protein NQ176_g2900 [Zarea fungicola]|uniref:Uncharacterized protein n=1 Tax=Zarea fungicola TaxID=93591 RepID=A0ACC1NNT2_9HYPO|nr:hypothetical protein NQ176_g2900 [Lecanicillium fungicola]
MMKMFALYIVRDFCQGQRAVSHSPSSLVITEIAHGLEFRISELKHDNTDHKTTTLEHAVDTILQSDDVLLTSLQKLGWELSEPDPEEAKSTDKLRETSQQQHSSNHPHVDPDEVEALQAEVESLYSEILPVAQMSVEQQHLEPALQSISARSGQSLRKTALSLHYIDQCLDHLLGRIAAVEDHAKLYNAHQSAVDRVVATAREEMAAEVPDPASETLALPIEAYGDGTIQSQIDALSEDPAREEAQGGGRGPRAVFAETPFGQPSLVDRGIEQSIEVLGQEVDKAREKLERLEDQKMGFGSLKRDEFVERWAR